MCDDEDEEVVALGGDLYQHLLANGLNDFEAQNRTPRQAELDTHVKKIETKFKSMSFLNMFIPYKKCNMSLIQEIRDCHLLLEEDALYLESLCTEEIEVQSNVLRTACIGVAVAWPVMLLCHVSCKRLFSLSCTGLGLLSVRQLIGTVRQRIDHKLMSNLVSALKGFSAICRRSQSLAQEWEIVSGSMAILKDTSLLRAKMYGIDELKTDLVRFLRLCVTNLSESSRDIVSITTGSDLHPLCMEVMRSEVMLEHSSTLSKAKKLHYLYVLVQSDYLKNVAISFIPCSKSVSNMAACAVTVKSCVAYTTQYVQECTRILTEKYEKLKNYTPQTKMTESIYKQIHRASTFGDVRQTVNNITVCLEALTLQSLLAQRTLEQYDDSTVVNDIVATNNVAELDKICCETQDALLGLQADLHATQCSVELAVKQLTRLRKSDFEKRAQEEKIQQQDDALRSKNHSVARTDIKRPLQLCDLPDNNRDEVFELCEHSAHEIDEELDERNSLQESIQKRAEQRVAGKLLKELKTALVGKRAEMFAREELARAGGVSKILAAESPRDSAEDMITSLMDRLNDEIKKKVSRNRVQPKIRSSTPNSSQNDRDISENVIEPDVCSYKSVDTELDDTPEFKAVLDFNDVATSSKKADSSVTKASKLTVDGSSTNENLNSHKELQTPKKSEPLPKENIEVVENEHPATEKKVEAIRHSELMMANDSVCRDSSLESLFLAEHYSDLSVLKDQLLESNDEKPESEYEYDYASQEIAPERDMEVQVLSRVIDFCAVSSSEDGCVDSEIRVRAEAKRAETDNDDGPVSNGDYLLSGIPRRPKPFRRHASSRQRYKYQHERGDSRVQPLMGFKLPNEAVTRAREMNLAGEEESFGNSD